MVDTKQIVGYVLAGLGLIGIAASSISSVKDAIFGYLPDAIVSMIGTSILVISLIILIVGVVLLYLTGRGHGKQDAEEVPIYKGKKIVGYRRVD